MVNSHMKGFLGTWASLPADLNLVIQLIMGGSLIAGSLLARAKHYVAHGVCQTTVVVLNLVITAVRGNFCSESTSVVDSVRCMGFGVKTI
jgi:hypothetical protein